MPILTVGEKFPEFNLTALTGGDLHDVNANQPEDYFEQVSLDKYEGKWKVVFFVHWASKTLMALLTAPPSSSTRMALSSSYPLPRMLSAVT